MSTVSLIMCVSGGNTGAMVTLNRLSVEDPDDGSPLLPEAAEAATPTPVFHKQRVVIKADSRDFFLSRYISAGATFILWTCFLMLQ